MWQIASFALMERWQPQRTSGIQQTLLKPYRVASILTALALVVSLGFLAYTALSSAQRLDPLLRHLAYLKSVQNSAMDIQNLLVRYVEKETPPTSTEIETVSKELEAIEANGHHMYPETTARLREAQDFLNSSNMHPEAGLPAALTTVFRTYQVESDLHREAVTSVKTAAETEFTMAAAALFFAPLSAMLALAYFRQRMFQSLGLLSEMLENVGNLDFQPFQALAPNDSLKDVFHRYNEMTEKLRIARDAANQQQEALESQVRTATEMLLRQQSELSDGARLAALGEFSARVAHELRNPIAGVIFALRNLEIEVDNADQKERLELVVSEMERVTRLLNALLDQSPSGPETSALVDLQSLVGDVVRLFRYQARDNIEVRLAVEQSKCTLPRDTVRQVLLNLLRNSLEAIGTNPGLIEIVTERVGNKVQLTVSDNGPGYPEDILKQGIRPFQSRKSAGTGLGLSIIQRLVRSAGGELRLGRGAHGGAVTTVILPCMDTENAHNDDH